MDDRVRDDPPEYEDDAEDWADAAREYATEEARDDAAEAWHRGHYQPGVAT